MNGHVRSRAISQIPNPELQSYLEDPTKIRIFQSRQSCFNKHTEGKWLTFNIKVHALLVPSNPTRSFTVISPWIWQLHILNMQRGASMLPFDFDTAVWALFTSIQEKERFYACFVWKWWPNIGCLSHIW